MNHSKAFRDRTEDNCKKSYWKYAAAGVTRATAGQAGSFISHLRSIGTPYILIFYRLKGIGQSKHALSHHDK